MFSKEIDETTEKTSNNQKCLITLYVEGRVIKQTIYWAESSSKPIKIRLFINHTIIVKCESVIT